jgi:hypothetical protein
MDKARRRRQGGKSRLLRGRCAVIFGPGVRHDASALPTPELDQFVSLHAVFERGASFVELQKENVVLVLDLLSLGYSPANLERGVTQER